LDAFFFRARLLAAPGSIFRSTLRAKAAARRLLLAR
jgi:hypothetical protein